ncbi:hypothetical protein [Agrobacterium fabrum]|uniref:hypothetical protein n=1 Tax=Agrobacterium fabrum TaxID=1176649 RepID=UPI000A442C9F|nr:hypothetical protein [Agrobacterium fabrum]UXT60865.1 hypothetical protein FY134_24625 [Agrobacterium fabrum]WCK79777.1 hypothetical protein G6L39_025380 [Agrobacterium fabrum]
MFDQVWGFVVEDSLVLKRQRNIFVVFPALLTELALGHRTSQRIMRFSRTHLMRE